VLASGSREREPGICHHRCQVFSTHATCRPVLCGGKCLNTSLPRKCYDGSIMESRWSSQRVFPLCRNLRRRNSSIGKMWILPSRIFSRTDVSGCIKTLLREATSSSPDQGFTLTPPNKAKQCIVDVLCSLNDTTVKRQTTYEDLHMIKSVVRPQDWMLSLDVESVFFHVPIHPKHRKFFSSHLTMPLFVKNKFIEVQPGGYFLCSRPDLVSSMSRLKRLCTCATSIIKSSNFPMPHCRLGGRARPGFGRSSCP
jgi:hypothetical protein